MSETGAGTLDSGVRADVSCAGADAVAKARTAQYSSDRIEDLGAGRSCMTKTGLTETRNVADAALYVVATPIGNLADLTLRALEVLKSVSAVAAEDTRVTQKLLGHHGIRARLVSLHEHNERAAAVQLTELLAEGHSVALVTDAGTPGISDPGASAVAHVRDAGYRVVPVPGASAVIAAISASGMPALPFCFHGFLPSRRGEREQVLREISGLRGLQVFYEAPHRIVESIESMVATLGGDRRITMARELTKLFEQIHTCALHEASGWLRQDEDRQRGEFVLMVEGEAVDAVKPDNSGQVLEILLRELPLSRAVALAAEITGARKNLLYEKALELAKG